MQWRMRIVIAGAALAAVALLVVAGLLVMRLRAPKPVDLPTWAARGCEATAAFAETLIKARDNVEPSTLELNARKERAARIGKVEVETARRLAKDLRAVVPPASVAEYHRALIASADDYAATAEEQIGVIAKATTAQQIAVANASARFRLSGSDQNVAAAAANLPPAAVAALEGEPKCRADGARPEPTPGA